MCSIGLKVKIIVVFFEVVWRGQLLRVLFYGRFREICLLSDVVDGLSYPRRSWIGGLIIDCSILDTNTILADALWEGRNYSR